MLGFLLCLVFLAIGSVAGADYNGIGGKSLEPEVVKSFAPSAIPSEIADPIQNLLDARPQGAGIFNPAQKAFFFNWKITGTSQIWRSDKPLGKPEQVTNGAEETTLLDVSPDGRFIVFSRDSDGEENPGLYVQPSHGGEVQVLQHKPNVKTLLGFVADDSRYVFYNSNDIKSDSFAIYRYDLVNKQSTLLFDEEGSWRALDYSNSGEILLVLYKASLSQEFYLFDPKTKTKTPLLGQNENTEYQMYFAPKKNEYFVVTNKMTDFQRLYLWSTERGFSEIPVFSPKGQQWDVKKIEVDAVRSRIYVSTNENGFTKLRVFSAKTLKPISFPTFSGVDHTNVHHLSRDGRYVTLSTSSSSVLRKLYVYDWKTKILTNWVNSSSSERDPKTFPKAEQDYYWTRDNVKIPMLVRRPAQCKNKLCPVVVSFHGGPEGQSVPGFNPKAQMFIDAGFIYVEPNVRGSDGYGKEWIDSDNGPKRLNVITDIEDCALYLRKNWQVNGVAPKLGVTGYSYGGYSTLMAMSRFAGAYDAGVALVGMSNLVSFLENTAPYRRKLRISEYGDPNKDLEALKKLSPINYIDNIKSPLLIIQGVNDPRVPVGEAIQIHQTLQKKKIASSLILFPDEGHGSKKRSNQVLEIGHTIQFFKQHLLKR
jgi:dipeptidyl aminopeptidase/acylaminoacyl peptidase